MPRPTRRHFLGTSLSAGFGLPLLGSGIFRDPVRAADPPPARKLEILILGGTGFLGPATVEAALARGHEITLFNRGRTNTHLFPDLEKLRGDRDGKLDALKGRKWDAVIDTSVYVPRIARMSAELLKDAVEQYVVISSISVYPGFGTTSEPIDEDTPVGTVEDETTEEITGESYGPLKALCEQTVEAAMPGRVTNIRPGLIVGPGDNTDRFTYWPMRVHRGGEILAPGDGSNEVQFIDVRDLGAWTIHCLEQKITGVFNATGFDGLVSMQEFLHGCKCTLNTKCSFTWATEDFLAEQKVAPWMGLPLWIPKAELPHASVERAIANGLTFRPISETIADTLKWALESRGDRRWRAGISAEREAEVLAAWREARQGDSRDF